MFEKKVQTTRPEKGGCAPIESYVIVKLGREFPQPKCMYLVCLFVCWTAKNFLHLRKFNPPLAIAKRGSYMYRDIWKKKRKKKERERERCDLNLVRTIIPKFCFPQIVHSLLLPLPPPPPFSFLLSLCEIRTVPYSVCSSTFHSNPPFPAKVCEMG